MLQAALAAGTAHRRSVFELFPRRLPEGRRYGVVAGVGRALDAIEDFRFDDEALPRSSGVVDEPTLRLAGRLPLLRRRLGLPRGRGLLPLLAAAGRRGRPSPRRCCWRPLLLSIYNHDSAIASAASRMTLAAGDRPCIEMGSRRTHEEAAVAAARAAYVAGFADHLQPRGPRSATACRRPAPARTASRCCTTPRPTRSGRRCSSLGAGTTLLVDTYDVAEAVRARRSRWPAPASARSASTPATSACSPARCAPSSTTSGATTPASW